MRGGRVGSWFDSHQAAHEPTSVSLPQARQDVSVHPKELSLARVQPAGKTHE